MPSQLLWSNRAHTNRLPSQGSFAEGDARWCGYEDVARYIASNPKDFTEVDRAKARNILLNIGRVELAARIEEVEE